LSAQGDRSAAVGLRERKKARTRTTIQQHALRLFGERGYQATTVEQICEVAEVSESTFFRYFPTKEDVVLWDEFDPLLVEAFRAQPPQASPIQALRASFRGVFADLSAEQRMEQRQRLALILSVPEPRAAMLNQFTQTIGQVAQLVAERVGRPADELAVRNLAGAVIGVSMAVMLTAAEDPTADWVALIDNAFAHLEAGLPV
jgi:AcrR family transcriptional regulator